MGGFYMRITHYIRKPQNYLADISSKSKFVVGTVIDVQSLSKRFKKLSTKVYVPKIENGINGQRNIIGEYKPDKTKPKETRYRVAEWHLTDWGGYEHSGWSYIPYKRYPRSFIEPKGIEFTLTELATGQKIIVANKIFEKYQLAEKDLTSITFIINLLIEATGSAEIYQLDEITGLPVRKVKTINWGILPAGERIWNFVKHRMNQVSKSERHMIKERFEFLESYYPTEIYRGEGSYTGYVVFYYKEKGLYMFDSIMYGKATYVFDVDWEKVSHLTKKQIIDNHIAKERIIHSPSWKRKIERLLK